MVANFERNEILGYSGDGWRLLAWQVFDEEAGGCNCSPPKPSVRSRAGGLGADAWRGAPTEQQVSIGILPIMQTAKPQTLQGGESGGATPLVLRSAWGSGGDAPCNRLQPNAAK
ncbi:MAG: hypothetical protein R3F11_22230 [Verrucomicrobiales bacterium]